MAVSASRGYSSAHYNFDTKQVVKTIADMEDKSGKVMAETLTKILREQARKSQSYINSSVPSRQRFMGKKVADSLTVETFGDGQNEAEVVFGSDPIGEGGVEGSRGGKLAIILEKGGKAFEYKFTFKTIDPSPSFAIGGSGLGNFINAKAKPTHPGFKGIGWLEKAYKDVFPQIEQALITNLKEEFA